MAGESSASSSGFSGEGGGDVGRGGGSGGGGSGGGGRGGGGVVGVCADLGDFQRIDKLGKGAFGSVYSARHKKRGDVVALKRVILHHEESAGFPISSVREIAALRRLGPHDGILGLDGVAVGAKREAVFLVTELCEEDLLGVLERGGKVEEGIAKGIVVQLLQAVSHMHSRWTLHRDIKPSNVLVKNGVVKLADFGSSRKFGYPLRPYTPLVQTLWYRAPELLYGVCGEGEEGGGGEGGVGEANGEFAPLVYGTAVDVWSVGCVFGELLCGKPLFQGHDAKSQRESIAKSLGGPTASIYPHLSHLPHHSHGTSLHASHPFSTLPRLLPPHTHPNAAHFLALLLAYDPLKRPLAPDALSHPYLTETMPPPATPFQIKHYLAKRRSGTG